MKVQQAVRWKRLQKLFHAASDLTAEQRSAFLTENCADDSGLLQEVEALVKEDHELASFGDLSDPGSLLAYLCTQRRVEK